MASVEGAKMSTYDKKEKLEEKLDKDYSNYRLERFLEIILGADLKRLNELCQNEKNNMKPSSLRNKLGTTGK